MRHYLLVVSALLPLFATSGPPANAANPAQQPQRADVGSALSRLEKAAGSSLIVSADPATGAVRFLRLADAGGSLPVSGAKSHQPVDQAQAFLEQHGKVFGIANPSRQLVAAPVVRDAQGGSHVVYRQIHRGLPVVDGQLRLHFAADGALYAVNGRIVPGLTTATRPDITPAAAARAAIERVIREQAAAPADDGSVAEPSGLSAQPKLRVAERELVIFHPGLSRGIALAPRLAWRVLVTDAAAGTPASAARNVRETVFVDALDGRVIASRTGIHSALSRRIYRGSTASQVWAEGQPLPYAGSGSADTDAGINRLITASADTYRFFENLSAGTFLSYDGRDGTMGAVYAATSFDEDECPNASWNGSTTNYCAELAIDDVVAHEWAHAYTQFTHDLVYEWQPGALNEAYSDIFGETVDLLNGSGSDEPQGPRTAGTCSTFSGSSAVQVVVLSPASIAGTYTAGGAEFGPSLAGISREADLVLAEDASNTEGPATTDGCTAFTNAGAVNGKIALIDRGTCTFLVKVKNAQDAGAIAAIVVNNQGDSLLTMSGEDASITIPSAFVRQSDGATFKGELAAGVRVRVGGSSGGDNSRRWLIAEDEAGTGSALRDMWHPNCRNHPGRSLDPAYFCTTGSPRSNNDFGGVHLNSGVPNHAYALLVDGGTYTGQTVQGLGLVKAAHIYWRAMTLYQTSTSDFFDHADALSQSCADLANAGTNLPSLTSRSASGEIITGGDCDQLAKVIAATQLRSNATPCAYAPLLAQSPPARCSAGVQQSFFTSNFESGSEGWTEASESPAPNVQPLRWELVSNLPDGRPGQAYFAPAELPLARCSPEAGQTHPQVKRLTSPAFTIPTDATSPRIALQHWLATGPLDGGNLEVAVNGGAFTLVPETAFRYNGYHKPLGPFSDNPLINQPGWSGTDAGSHSGTWGETQVDFTGLARPGDSVRLRLSFGTAQCGENEGWYVDDVTAYHCKLTPTGPCVADSDTLCLLGGRYQAEVAWNNQFDGTSGRGIAQPNADFTGFFAFNDPSNIELILKMLEFDGVVKVFYGQLTNLRFELTITDTLTGAQKRYGNGAGECGDIDQNAFVKALPGSDAAGSCVPGEQRLCLGNNRFQVEVDWRNQFSNQTGSGNATVLSDLTGLFTFTDPRNVELLTKTLDFGDRILFIYGSLSDLEYTIRVTDTNSGAVKTYVNAPGNFCGQIDDDAF